MAEIKSVKRDNSLAIEGISDPIVNRGIGEIVKISTSILN